MDIITRTFLDDKARAINHLKGQIAENVIEIGRHLSEARSMCEKGTWLKWAQANVEFTERQAQSYIHVFNKFGNTKSTSHLGIEKLKLLAQLPDDIQPEQYIEDHDIENKSVRELKELIKSQTGLSEIEKKQIAEDAYQKGIIDEKRRTEKETEKRDKAMEELVKKRGDLMVETSTLKKQIEQKEKQINDLVRQVGDSRKVERLKSDIEKLKATRQSYQQEIDEIGELARLKVEVENLIKKVAPIRYMQVFKNTQSMVARNTLSDIMAMIDEWAKDMDEIMNTIHAEARHE